MRLTLSCWIYSRMHVVILTHVKRGIMGRVRLPETRAILHVFYCDFIFVEAFAANKFNKNISRCQAHDWSATLVRLVSRTNVADQSFAAKASTHIKSHYNTCKIARVSGSRTLPIIPLFTWVRITTCILLYIQQLNVKRISDTFFENYYWLCSAKLGTLYWILTLSALVQCRIFQYISG